VDRQKICAPQLHAPGKSYSVRINTGIGIFPQIGSAFPPDHFSLRKRRAEAHPFFLSEERLSST